MEKKSMVNVPFIAYEKDIEHRNSIIKFMFAIIIVLVIILGLSFYMFMSFINNFEFSKYYQEGHGLNNINEGTQGDVINESTTSKND